MKERISRDEVIDIIMKSTPEDYTYDDYDGLYVYNSDINLRLLFDKSDEFTGPFKEPWVSKFADQDGKRQLVRIYYLSSLICKVHCVWVDGCRSIIPIPRIKDNAIEQFKYKIGLILNNALPNQGLDFNQALHLAGIKVLNE
jgi:hypothetical protein